MNKKLLLIEDDSSLSTPLIQLLKAESYDLELAPTLKTARAKTIEEFDLVILDWRLPDGQGIELLKEWRAQNIYIPVILLTSRSDLIDKVLGLELGADDYLTKPFEMRELIARIMARLRRSAPPLPDSGQCISQGGIRLFTASRTANFQNSDLSLTKTEFDLLKILIENPGRAFTRDELLNLVWGYQNYPTTRTVDMHIMQLRQKIAPELFVTVHGVGYRFETGK